MARGTDGREFPWGDEFDEEKCNSGESGGGKTTNVTLHPDGISYYGCYDMAGNVWELTNSWYDENKNTHVIRGGSWGLDSDLCRCDTRKGINPDIRHLGLGFRCAKTLNS